jgi:hypothetical protein
MDPLTLFALANGAVAAVKKGCQLYKDIKGAAGDVKAVLKDLDEQFNKAHRDKPPTSEQRKQYIEEKNRVIELNKKGGETDDVYTTIGEKLGEFFENYHKCKTVIEEEERRSHEEYTGDASVGKRALQLVLMKKKLEQMSVELRETVVYQSPPELGALWTDVNNMMERMNKEQSVFIQRNMRREAAEARRREAWMKQIKADAYIGGFFLFLLMFIGGLMAVIAHDAQQRHPEWKNGNARATLEIIRKQEIARVLEEANTRADTRYKQLKDASTVHVKIDDGESNGSSN